MDAKEILSLQPMLKRYLQQFADCFDRKDTRAHLGSYVHGQLSELPRKSVEPIALAAGMPVRTLQEFLSQHRWHEDRVRERLQQKVAHEHAHSHAIGIIDETSFRKKGNKTPGVKRQHCGTIGKQDNCIVTVHLAYAAGDFHCLLDGELFLPEDWSADRLRCKEAGIPEDMRYRPKTEIALELYDRARANGVNFAWLTFDEWYGAKPAFLRGLWTRKQSFAGEVPRSLHGWITPPPVTRRPYRRYRRGRSRTKPRLRAGSQLSETVESLVNEDPRLQRQAWQKWRVKDGDKGPLLWETKHVPFFPQDPEGLPGPQHLLVIARNVLNPSEIKFFLGFAISRPRVSDVLQVGFTRWRVERSFEDSKGEIGMAHYEGRCYQGLKRHLILSSVSFLFLAESRERLRGKKSGVDGLPGTHGCKRIGPILVA